ncbi:hypothetical protein [Paenibacillus xylanilyticus]|uniref:hypothetical protein n=1 Tax=Paenibacillus xylanilyticus TaxID=248903 RepID=UPI0039A263C1
MNKAYEIVQGQLVIFGYPLSISAEAVSERFRLGGSFVVAIAVVEHQKLLTQWGMRRASVAVGSAIAKMQLNRISKESEHQTEFQWETYDEALAFLLK